MDAKLLRAVGEALDGPRWQSEMARKHGVAVRTVQRWAAGQSIPDGLWPELRKDLRERQEMIAGLLERLPV